tara:strand:- start:365 stop:805 length:441 start_codon:yes stop_codon:yes gene_type:complete
MRNKEIISKNEHNKWMEKINKRYYYLLFTRNTPIGLGYFTDVNISEKTSFWGCYIGEQNSIPGIGAILNCAILKIGFEFLGFRKLFGEVLLTNKSALLMQKSFGLRLKNNYDELNYKCFEIDNSEWKNFNKKFTFLLNKVVFQINK